MNREVMNCEACDGSGELDFGGGVITTCHECGGDGYIYCGEEEEHG